MQGVVRFSPAFQSISGLCHASQGADSNALLLLGPQQSLPSGALLFQCWLWCFQATLYAGNVGDLQVVFNQVRESLKDAI